MTYPEAALKILEEAGRPLDHQQITFCLSATGSSPRVRPAAIGTRHQVI
jgi:hypothetical protein